MTTTTATTLAAAIDELLGAHAAEVVLGAETPLARLGLAFDGSPSLASRATADGLDALVLHRCTGFEPPPGLAVLACHDAFDERLGLGGNRWLHAELGLEGMRPLAPKAILADAPADLRERVAATFGGEEAFHQGAGAPVRRAVLADAMTEELVHAAAAGAELYVTGTWRVPAGGAVTDAALAVQIVGHRRQERWSLRLLARLLAERLPGVGVVPFA